MQAQLIPIDGGEPVLINRNITVVGRKADVCDWVIHHEKVSKQHCLIVKTDGLLFLRDLQSTNGTKVNGQKITRGALLPGDQLTIGTVEFRVNLAPDQTENRGNTENQPNAENPANKTKTAEKHPTASNPQNDNEKLTIDNQPSITEPHSVLPDLLQDSESDVRLLSDDSVV